jgi:hypothetical protein
MNAIVKQIAIATVAIGTCSFAASAEGLYRELVTAQPSLTFTRKHAAKAFVKTVNQAVNYERVTGLKMTNSHATELFYKNLAAIAK